jgi:hypothetical protein
VATWFKGAVDLLAASGSTDVSTLSDPFTPNLRAAFPTVRTLADLRQLANDAGVVFANFSGPQGVRCSPTGTRCPAGRLGFQERIAVTATAQSRLPAMLDPSGAINVCPAFLTAADADAARAMYALVASQYLGGAMIQRLAPTDAMTLATFAQLVVERYLPPPRARDPIEHLRPAGP